MANSTLHIAACVYTALGHIRALVAFISDLVDTRPNVVFTVFVYKSFFRKLEDEVNRWSLPDSAKSRIRLIGVSEIDAGEGLAALAVPLEETAKCVPPAYATVAAGGAVTCTSTGNVLDYSEIPAPRVALSDVMTPFVGQALKAITPNVKLLVFWPLTHGYFNRFYGSKNIGGLAEWEEDTKSAMAEESNQGRPFAEVARDVERRCPGGLYRSPDGWEAYDYELYPQEMPPGDISPIFMASISQARIMADGTVFACSEDFEPKSAHAIREWYERDMGKSVFFVGSRSVQRILKEESPSKTGGVLEQREELHTFLKDKAAKSVWLISFGTFFYPFLHPSHVTALIEALLESQTPFIFAQASIMSTLAPLAPEFRERIVSSGLGHITEWVPQQELLQHPALGAFVTHGGANSTLEAVAAGVVPIFWPFTTDQPFYATYLSQQLDCGFELIQVRTGPGAQQPRRGGIVQGTDEAVAGEVKEVIECLGGEIGQKKRSNLAELRARLTQSLELGGAADSETEKFFAFLGGA
ncbi:glycosyltransferase family 1 protein [Tulasnella calospora MUT 4182]|uniref:Glycosyltransferase family 1 protein n=1 Tax=Tulasnella calospora MUT 4182 TaxID=1051891 RepID=A0A0C3LD99_9AGAM|nr:glycosyltransferase family 1 protein [Tulasnella calospora MUT 4182]